MSGSPVADLPFRPRISARLERELARSPTREMRRNYGAPPLSWNNSFTLLYGELQKLAADGVIYEYR